MKIGILSMQRIDNHGSFLQSYALKSVLNGLGHEVFFLDIKKGDILVSELEDEYHSGKRRYTVSEFFGRLSAKIKDKKQKKIFREEQRNLLHLGEEYNCDEKCDAAIIGSDEVFNSATNTQWGLTTQLFGDIPNAGKVITYAASCGGTTYESIPEQYHERIGNALNHLERLSVRDKNTKNFVEKYWKNAVYEHLDPVFIYDFQKEIKAPEISFPYVLIYSYHNRIHKKRRLTQSENLQRKEI